MQQTLVISFFTVLDLNMILVLNSSQTAYESVL